ncbi:MAG: EamA family transporter [Planctomycetota bacterium]|nr:MAG: EamA family transporter [Planctomycetota bacterium]
MAACIGSLLALWRRDQRRYSQLTLLLALLFALFTLLGNLAMVASLSQVHPALTATLVQTQVIMVIVGELIFLGGRLSRGIVLGGLLGLLGFVVLQEPWRGSWQGPVWWGALWALVAAACFSTMLLVTKAVIQRVDIFGLNMLRLWLAALILGCWPGALEGALAFSPWLWLLALLAGLAGPTLGRLHLMLAVRHISASQAKLITLSTPAFALVMGWLAFADWPTSSQLLGGGIILAGVALPLWELWRRHRQSLVVDLAAVDGVQADAEGR